MSRPIVTPADLEGSLGSLGITRGARLVVHSSLSSFGHFEGGAPALCRALQSQVTPEGLIMMTAFTYGRAPFDPARSPTLDGAVAEAFRQRPGVRRSTHPTHSVTAWGDEAAPAVAGHEDMSPFAAGSPLHRLAQHGGRVLLMGVDHQANSLLHVAQCLAAAPYVDRFRDSPVLERDGSVRQVRARRAGCSRGFGAAAEPLDAAALEAGAQVGLSRLRLFRGDRLLEAATRIFKADPAALLCADPSCGSCAEARAMCLDAQDSS
jgi:aminoglycoside N3'-acetyltransferase